MRPCMRACQLPQRGARRRRDPDVPGVLGAGDGEAGGGAVAAALGCGPVLAAALGCGVLGLKGGVLDRALAGAAQLPLAGQAVGVAVAACKGVNC